MKKCIAIPIVLSFMTLFSLHCHSESAIEQLSPELRSLLSQEMIAIEKGMQKIVPAYISGDFSRIGKIAQQIKQSYILKQKMSNQQTHELHEVLPSAFIQKDKSFHKYAGMLAHVSEKKNRELVGFYYSRMLSSCVDCHSQYATHRFPKLSIKVNSKSHDH